MTIDIIAIIASSAAILGYLFSLTSKIFTIRSLKKELEVLKTKAVIDILHTNGLEMKITLDTKDENSIRNFLESLEETPDGKSAKTN